MRVENPGFLRLLLIILLLNILGAQLLHEAGHWAVMQSFGRRPLWGFTSLVQLSESGPSTPADWVELTNLDGSLSWLRLESLPATDAEWLLFLAAGPLAQVAAMVIGFMIARFSRSAVVRTMGFILALVNAFGGLLYQLVGLLRGGGSDETLIAHYLEVSPVPVSAVLAVAFGIGLVLAARTLATWKMRLQWGAALILGTLPIGPLLMRANNMVIEQVDAGHPFFRSLVGFSLPVFMTRACFSSTAQYNGLSLGFTPARKR
jgi:hypothetical protein